MDAETIFAILVGAALACFGLAMVAYSFIRGSEPEDDAPVPRSQTDADGVGLDSLLDSVDTLELEFQLGNVPEGQYLQHLESYRLQIAALVMEQLENGIASPELELERDVLLARSRVNGSWRSCPRCDAPLPGALGENGASLACPHCGASLDDVRAVFTPHDAEPANAERSEVP